MRMCSLRIRRLGVRIPPSAPAKPQVSQVDDPGFSRFRGRLTRPSLAVLLELDPVCPQLPLKILRHGNVELRSRRRPTGLLNPAIYLPWLWTENASYGEIGSAGDRSSVARCFAVARTTGTGWVDRHRSGDPCSKVERWARCGDPPRGGRQRSGTRWQSHVEACAARIASVLTDLPSIQRHAAQHAPPEWVDHYQAQPGGSLIDRLFLDGIEVDQRLRVSVIFDFGDLDPLVVHVNDQRHPARFILRP